MAKDFLPDRPVQDAGGAGSTEALDAYAALDLSPGSSLIAGLMDGVQHEHAEGGRIDLTDQLGGYQPGFTPQMQAWFLSEIESKRTPALDEIRSGFEMAALSRTAAGRGKLVPAERAKNDRDKLVNYNLIHTSFRRDHEQNLEERESRRAEFEQARAENGNRDPVLTPIGYWVVLIGVVLLEIGVNFESLMQLSFVGGSPFFAGCGAILIGLAVGVAAHFHGTILKQWHYWFQSHDSGRAWEASRKVAFSTVLLTAALGMIGWARASYVMPQIDIAIIRGLPPPNLFLSVLFMTMTNVIVYGVGAAFAYFWHDRDPEYPPKKIELEKAEKILGAFKARINRKLDECDDRWYAQAKKLGVFETSQSASPAWADNSKGFARFCAVENRVESVLQRYKSALVSRLRSEGLRPVFAQPTVTRDDGAREERLTAEQYLGRPVELKLL